MYKIKQFYNIIEKVPTLSGKLTWSHWYEMLSINDLNKIIYYVKQSEINNLDVRSLREKIKSNEYERLDKNTKNKSICKNKGSVVDFVKNPILIKNGSNYDSMSEKILQKLILEDIPSFLKEFLKNNFIYNQLKN